MIFPRLLVITQPELMRPDFAGALAGALHGGARLIQLRANETDAAGVLRLAQTAKTLCEAAGAQLFVNGNAAIAQRVKASGVHLRESQSVARAREFLGQEYSIGQSVHSLENALRARNEGADYVVFGSVFATASHPGRTPAGLDALRAVTGEIAIPVFAIGGITPENAAECRSAGAHGVGAIRAIWDAAAVAEATHALAAALER